VEDEREKEEEEEDQANDKYEERKIRGKEYGSGSYYYAKWVSFGFALES